MTWGLYARKDRVQGAGLFGDFDHDILAIGAGEGASADGREVAGDADTEVVGVEVIVVPDLDFGVFEEVGIDVGDAPVEGDGGIALSVLPVAIEGAAVGEGEFGVGVGFAFDEGDIVVAGIAGDVGGDDEELALALVVQAVETGSAGAARSGTAVGATFFAGARGGAAAAGDTGETCAA